jgi:hypothetical protein
LGVDLHELVLGDHLLERAEGRLDLLAGGDIVADIVDEGCDGDSARVGLCCCDAGGVSLVWFEVGCKNEEKGCEDFKQRNLSVDEQGNCMLELTVPLF